MIEEMILTLFMFVASIVFYKTRYRLFVMLSAVFGLMINILALSAGIPFTPYYQIFLSIVELTLFIYSTRQSFMG